jgi:uncharacterized protein YggE
MNKLSLALVGMMALGVFAPSLMPAAVDSNGTISVNGDAVVKVVPDEVVITLGVMTRDNDLHSAKDENDRSVKKVVNLARGFGIEAKHIQTDFINISPEYEYSSYDVDRIVGYRVRMIIVITLKDISKFDDLLTGVLELGANFVRGVEFRTTELRKYRDQARALAIKAAEEKATALAGELGNSIGAPITIIENQSNWWSSYGSWWGRRWGETMSQNVIQNAGLEGFTTEGGLAPGQLSVNASVSVTFELK